ncbi:hypothetical protein KBD34_01585 [Patescibacteria group bacterium]|nr:hypothetical protein [Patescibacteria group bacterium]
MTMEYLQADVIPLTSPDRSSDEPSLTPAELAKMDEIKFFAQGCLAACFVNDRMPHEQVERYEELERLAESADLLTEKASLHQTLNAERENLSMQWMLNKQAEPRFSKMLGDLLEVALGETQTNSTTQERNEALRFTRGLLELISDQKIISGPFGYRLPLSPEQLALAKQLQAELERREQLVAKPTLH